MAGGEEQNKESEREAERKSSSLAEQAACGARPLEGVSRVSNGRVFNAGGREGALDDEPESVFIPYLGTVVC